MFIMVFILSVEKAEVEEVEKAATGWAEFCLEENAEIYDDLEVVYERFSLEIRDSM